MHCYPEKIRIGSLFVTVAAALLAAVLRTVAMLTAYEPESGYFALDCLPLKLADGLSVLFVAGCLLLLPWLAGRLSLSAERGKLLPLTAAGLTLCCLFFGAKLLSGPSAAPTPFSDVTGLLSGAWVTGKVAAVFCLLGAVYFACLLLSRRAVCPVRALGGLAMVLFGLFYTLYLYYVPYLPLGSSLKSLHMAVFISVFLFFLYESRLALGRNGWAMHHVFGIVAAFLCLSTALPELVFLLVRGQSAMEDYAYALLLEALFLFIFARLCTLAPGVGAPHTTQPLPDEPPASDSEPLSDPEPDTDESPAADAEPCPDGPAVTDLAAEAEDPAE
ncbi:MAG: hypothetical protein WDA00_06290 [Eubacteriales bacterium]